jgi:hypothetical protein
MTVKGLAQKAISNQPDEASFDDIPYQIYVLECIEKGEQNIANGKVMTEAQVRQELEKWLLIAAPFAGVGKNTTKSFVVTKFNRRC